MADIFKSDGNTADNDADLIMAQSNSMSRSGASTGGLTNLTVMENIQEVIQHINLANSAYQNLLSKDAATITIVKEEYDRFDKELSECMGIE